jgi:class 3 adenylate cyclase/tetratricopeptide (TPR) repeat protein
MKCPKCQFDNPEAMKFCGECGAKLEIICPKCNSSNPPQFKFCGECGQNLTPHKKAAPIDYSQPESYTPKFLADKILTTRSSIEGERKLVTVLFADVANYTSMSEKLDPEEVHQIMDGCFKILMDEIHKYEGTINQFTGDGVMALFGAPVAHEDHAQRGCHAALAIQKSIKEYGKKIANDLGIDFKMRIGINSGPVVVGAIGDDLRMDYTAIGDTTNLASRMESLAAPGAVYISEAVNKLVKDFFEFESPDRLQVKGKEKPQKAYELIKPGAIETRIEASAAKGLTKFIGRKNSMAALKKALEKSSSGTGQVVGVVGEAGVGKSRLILELKRGFFEDEYTFLEGRCIHYGHSIAYLPFLEILKRYFQVREEDTESAIKHKMAEKIIRLDEKLQTCLPPFEDVLALKVEDDNYLHFEPRQKKERIFESIRDLFIRESQNKPLVIIIEDLHLIDKTSEQFLDYFIDCLTNSPILLILLYRPEYVHHWGSKADYSIISVSQLTSKSSARLIRTILYDCEIEPELETLILNRAEGTPLYIEEMTYSLLESGSIQRGKDQFFLAIAPEDIQVPDTLQGIIAARIDRIEENLKRIMQVASVIGREFAYRILKTITGMREELKSHLRYLQRLEFIYEKRQSPDPEYIFKHALTQEVAYNSLLLRIRKETHKKIGEAIEEIYAKRLEEFYEILAYHYTKGEHLEKALRYLKLSGEKSTGNHSLSEAIRFYRQALDMLNKQSETDKTKREKLHVHLSMAVPLRVAGYPEDSLHFLKEGKKLAKEIGDEKTLANFYSLIGNLYGTRGDTQLAQKYGEHCFEQSQKIQDVDIMAPAAYDLCNLYMFIGEYSKIIDLAPAVIQLLEETKRKSEFFSRPDNVYSELCGYYGLGLGLIGNFKKGAVFCEKSLRHATEIGDLRTIGFCENTFGYLYLTKGDWQLSIDHFQQCIKHFEKAQWLWPLSIAYCGLVHAFSFLNDRERVFKYLENVHRLQQESRIELFSSFLYWLLGKAYLNLEDLKNAQCCSEKALKLSQNHLGKWDEGLALILFGEIFAKTENKQNGNAEEYISRGIRILKKLKLKPHYSLGFLTLGEFYIHTSRKDKALETLKKAEGMFREMGMDYWLAKTQDVHKALDD